MVSSGLIDRVDVSHFRLSLHLLIAFLILSLIFWNYLKIKVKNNFQNTINIIFPLSFLFLVFLQISIGAFVSGMDAGKIYNSWPLMGDSIFPNDNSAINLFKLSAFSDPSLVQFIHRKLALVIFNFTFYLWNKGRKSKINIMQKKSLNLIAFLIIAQSIIGVLTLIYVAPIALALMHQIIAFALLMAIVYSLFLFKKIKLKNDL